MMNDIWADAPFANYTYPLDSLLNSSDSLQYAEAMRMLRDVYVVNVESSQGANQIINFSNRFTDSWLPSLFSGESLMLKLVLLVGLIFCLFLYLPAFKSKVNSYKGVHLTATVCLALMLLTVPFGADYYLPICLTFLGVGIVVLLIYGFVRISLIKNNNWLKPLLVILTIVLAFVNITKPIPSLSQVQSNDNPVDNYFWVVCSAFLLFTVLSFFITWSKHFECKRAKTYSEKKYLKRHLLLLWALFTWCSAFLIYFIGTYYSGTQRSLLTSLFRPALSACKIFILADNMSDITLAFRRSGVFMGMLSLTRLSGFLVSAQLIISLLGERVKASIRMRLAHAKDSSLYVFFGINSASVQVCKTITGAKGKSPLSIFVDSLENDISNTRTTFGFGTFISLFTHKHEAFEAVAAADRDELPALLTISSVKLEELSNDCTSLSSIALKNLQRLIGESAKTEFFFLSDNEKANIAAAKILSDLLDAQSGEKYTIYCNCRQGSMIRLLQFRNIRIEAVDSAKLAINQLKNESKPILTDLVNFDQFGCCTSTFRSLVIGMDDIGEEAVNFLYEFGAFVNSEKKRSDFECHVIDSRMKQREGDLYLRRPELKYQEGKREPNVHVELMQLKEGSEIFWDWLNHHIATLQFILIAVGEGEAQLNLADEIYNLAVRHRTSAPQLPLKIYVCAYSTNDANKLKLMAETYCSHNDYGNVQLIPFGMPDTLFTYDNISRRLEKQKAEQYFIAYQNATAKLSCGVQQTWMDRREKYEKDHAYASILEFLRMESQDISNEYHRKTKIAILKKALEQAALLDDEKRYSMENLYEALPESLSPDTDFNHIVEDDYLNTLIQNMAVIEHIRWNASHELQGFQYSDNVPKDLRSLLRKHKCLTDWSKLDDYTRLYDFAVVLTTLKLEKDGKQ
ncbi:MAG: hypothetical protein IKX59_09415 [Bacteroidales bacterium]|nr:hypothetical protein [Bacteroidales bacterium]